MKKPVLRPAAPLTIVGIGASAGGIEAIGRLLARLRPDLGLAYVVVMHLSPDYDSELVEVLQRSTAMKVAAAADGTRVEPDRVYVITPGTLLTLEAGALRSRPRDAQSGIPLPVDAFLRSLAEVQQRRAVAVVLSGAAHDGSLGARAVKSAGGIVFAQDPATAAQRSMPQGAIDAGAADFVLAPEDVAAELERVARHPYIARKPNEADPLLRDEANLRRIFAAVRAASGIDFTFYKSTTVGRRLLRRLAVHRLASLKDYAELVDRDPREARALAEETLIHVTHFFREPATFSALQRRVLPRLLKTLPKDAPVRVWVPGCSTGEEAYSIAISLLDSLGDGAHVHRVQVFATDVSDAAIDRARLGVYPEGVRNDVPARLLRRYFTKTDHGYQVSKSVRDACIFARQDLTKDPPFANLDIVSCRNVLIYLEPPMQRQIMPVFHYALKPSGALILGGSETVGDFASLFAVADKKARIYYKKPGTSPARFAFVRTITPEHSDMSPKPKSRPPSGWPEADVQRAAERVLLNRFAPAGVIVTEDLDILHFRGAIHRFLKPSAGKASLNLLKMLPTEWHVPLHALMQRAKKSSDPVRQDGILAKGPADEPVTLEIVPLQGPVAKLRCYMILFEFASVSRTPKPARAKAGGRADGREADRVRKELSSTKEYLQAVVEEHEAANEELKAANEEIISSNEELQSTNEELETAKEELQAANEELSTLNEELQTRNADLSQANHDLVNLLASVHLPIVMLGNDLRIRRFTPLAEKIMNLIPGDVGRPISDIKPKVEIPDLEKTVEEVLETVTTREIEVRDREGRSYSLRVRPYRTTENKIEGVVLVLIDTEAIRSAALQLRENTLFSEAILDMVSEPVAVLDAGFGVRSANPAFKRAFDLAKLPIGRSLFEIAGGRLDLPPLRAALKELSDNGHPFAALSLSGSGMKAVVSGRRLAERGQPGTILLTLAVHP